MIGTLPGDSTEEAMRAALDRLGPHLRRLPDGETGSRRVWIVGLIRGFRDHPDLEVAKDGDMHDYKSQLHFRVRKGHQLTGDKLDLGYLAAYRDSRPVFDRLTEEAGVRPTYQVGIPGDLNLAMFATGPTRMLRTRPAFTDATLRDLRQIHAESHGEVVFQLEVPAETVSVTMAPAPLRGLAAGWMAASVVKLAKAAPAGARFGVHLCLGDLGHQALGKLRTAAPLVKLANAVAARWPAGRPLDYVHAPLAQGDQPPSLDPEFYRPLAGLRLPPSTPFVAGFLHEGRSLDEQRRILAMIEDAVGHPVDVAAACGLGRRSPEAAYTTMDQARELCENN
ncbi:hypothetical protein [Fodinicola feengrottensis]|uniref:hypothetical protein n=1 Tax=Fodinicola feengrottensis TaxID=435914 RepID=UPI0024414E5A|nr:hypothetical protein [Fodinicola feengrottensis]